MINIFLYLTENIQQSLYKLNIIFILQECSGSHLNTNAVKIFKFSKSNVYIKINSSKSAIIGFYPEILNWV